MAASDELARLLVKAGAVPYRRVGKIRVAHDPRTPADTLKAVFRAVEVMARDAALVDRWGEPPGNKVTEWRKQGLVPADVCDDPCPRDVDPKTCPAAWLVARCQRYHFRCVPAPGGLAFEGTDGWELKSVVPLLPAWFTNACRTRRQELVEHLESLKGTDECHKSLIDSDLQPAKLPVEVCGVCGRDVAEGDKPRLADAAFCPMGGSRAVTDGNGVKHPATKRCPYKVATE